MWTGLLHERHINWQDWQGHPLHWSDPLRKWQLWRECFYMCALSTVLVMDMNWIATRMAHSFSELEQAPRSLSHSSISNQRIFPTQGLRCLPSSSFFSFQHCEGHTLHWSDPLRKWQLWREWFCMCALSTVLVMDKYWLAVWTPHPLARLVRQLTRV